MFRRRINLPIEKNFFLSALAGIEAGVATTTAIIAGTLTSTDDRRIVIVSSLVALLVQAFNSAMNHITTAYANVEIDDQDPDNIKVPVAEAGLQFGMHVIASLIVLSPIILMESLQESLVVSVGAALLFLFLLGASVGLIVKHKPFRNGLQTMLLGSLVIIAGFVAGLIIQA